MRYGFFVVFEDCSATFFYGFRIWFFCSFHSAEPTETGHEKNRKKNDISVLFLQLRSWPTRLEFVSLCSKLTWGKCTLSTHITRLSFYLWESMKGTPPKSRSKQLADMGHRSVHNLCVHKRLKGLCRVCLMTLAAQISQVPFPKPFSSELFVSLSHLSHQKSEQISSRGASS